MKKRCVLFLAVILSLLLIPIAFAQPQDTSAFEDGFKILFDILEKPAVSVGLFMLLLFLVVNGAIQSGLKASPAFGAKGELGKEGKVVAAALSGIMLLGVFFIRGNAIEFVQNMAGRLGLFFAAIVSLTVYSAIRWMYKPDNAEGFGGDKVYNAIAWVAGWGTLLLFSTAWQSQMLEGLAWTGMVAGTFLYVAGGHWYTNKNADNNSRNHINRTNRDASNNANDAAAASNAAAAAGQQADQSLNEAERRMQEIEEARRKLAEQGVTPEGISDLRSSLLNTIESFKQVNESENEQIKKTEELIKALRNCIKTLDFQVQGPNGLNAILKRGLIPEHDDKVKKLILDTNQFVDSIKAALNEIESAFNQEKSKIRSNLSQIVRHRAALENISNQLKAPNAENIQALLAQSDEAEKNLTALSQENEELLKNIGRNNDRMEALVKQTQDQVKHIEEESKDLVDALTEEQIAESHKDEYDVAIEAEGTKSAAALVNLAKYADAGDFQKNKNLFVEAVMKLDGKPVRFLTLSDTKYGRIVFEKKYMDHILLGNLLVRSADGLVFLNLVHKENRLEFVDLKKVYDKAVSKDIGAIKQLAEMDWQNLFEGYKNPFQTFMEKMKTTPINFNFEGEDRFGIIYPHPHPAPGCLGIRFEGGKEEQFDVKKMSNIAF